MIILQPSVNEPTDEQLLVVSELPSLELLYVWPGGVQNIDNQPMSRNALGGMTDSGVDVLINKMNHLEHFATTSAFCSEAKLKELDNAMDGAELLTILPHRKSKTKPFYRK